MLDSENSEEQYFQTTLETDRLRMKERIAGLRQAFTAHLQEVEHDSNDHAERHQIEKALYALAQLEAETRHW